jgi:hypothetical protein
VRAKARDRDGGVKRALKAISVDSMNNVLVPNGMGGVIHVEHLLLTSRGVLVIDVKPYTGIVFASDRMDDWTVIRDGARASIANPLGALYDRVAAVKQLIKDVDVSGHILFPEGADFSKGQPGAVMLPSKLVAGYPLPDDTDRERVMVAFQPYWEKLRIEIETEAARTQA